MGRRASAWPRRAEDGYRSRLRNVARSAEKPRFNVEGAMYSLNGDFLVFASAANVLLLVKTELLSRSCGYGRI
jgi:hypothetical protein